MLLALFHCFHLAGWAYGDVRTGPAAKRSYSARATHLLGAPRRFILMTALLQILGSDVAGVVKEADTNSKVRWSCIQDW